MTASNGQTARVVVVYHSGFGHTEAIARSVHEGSASVAGVSAELVSTDALLDASGTPVGTIGPAWDVLHRADALIFGSPTYMGTVSAGFKRFMDTSGGLWGEQRWRDKLAAGFTVGGGLSGDKLTTLNAMAIFAAQHSMLWVSQGLMNDETINRMGSYLGMMAQADNAPADQTPPPADHETARRFGMRVSEATLRWTRGKP